ncbi:adenine nucleotide transporter BT1, chloroplastic/mitochondrial-like [Hibiscus syriacus]|uniref:adenine nucleotide transporter BT1, chloroplastic/mitochondrial-like n=1 Tax=Hibiscus syriacus TaxID=106335 RepID=UPI001922D377|nr:adenine nucleotide transporter BT1, chloroplastic/mitochondrial-like [Hibiscus syriacus]
MSASKKPYRRSQSSIKYRVSPAEGAFFEIGELVPEEYSPSLPDNNKKIRIIFEAKQSQILSTAEFISSLNQIWNSASCLAIPQQQTNLERVCLASLKEDISADSKYFCIDLTTARQFPSVMKPNFDFVKITKKISMIDSSIGNIRHSFCQGLLCCGSDFSNESWKGNGLAAFGFSFEVGNIYKWMRKMIPPAGLQYFSNVPGIANKKIGEYCFSSYRASLTENIPIENAEHYSHHIKSKDLSISHDDKLVSNTRGTTPLWSDYLLTDVQETNADCSVSRTSDSDLCADYHFNSLASHYSTFKEQQYLNNGSEYLENQRKQPELFSTDTGATESHSTASEKPRFALAKHEHAFSGAFAGIFVSLCLHPIDTVKTVLQSCNAEQKSIFYIGRSIISERGLTGLYRGIASNIASSAPISALYTFSYESVKGALLPLLPKEYHSLAHCMAGGCASVATSFIFTPSERIKQQMQIGVHHQNCWTALVEIVKKGGLPSLYTGWGAVLCRNIPQSIIKFYTYESLKQVMLSSPRSPAQLNTLQTLMCGALAGSTAAFFTTPFDVVKTRLQTQIPGSLSRYNNVYHALQDILMHEGLKGAYRGLVPRLVMYTTQGALFFASYEFLKQLLCLEAPQLTTHNQEKGNKDESSLRLPSSTLTLATRTSSSSSSSPSRLHS